MSRPSRLSLSEERGLGDGGGSSNSRSNNSSNSNSHSSSSGMTVYSSISNNNSLEELYGAAADEVSQKHFAEKPELPSSDEGKQSGMSVRERVLQPQRRTLDEDGAGSQSSRHLASSRPASPPRKETGPLERSRRGDPVKLRGTPTEASVSMFINRLSQEYRAPPSSPETTKIMRQRLSKPQQQQHPQPEAPSADLKSREPSMRSSSILLEPASPSKAKRSLSRLSAAAHRFFSATILEPVQRVSRSISRSRGNSSRRGSKSSGRCNSAANSEAVSAPLLDGSSRHRSSTKRQSNSSRRSSSSGKRHNSTSGRPSCSSERQSCSTRPNRSSSRHSTSSRRSTSSKRPSNSSKRRRSGSKRQSGSSTRQRSTSKRESRSSSRRSSSRRSSSIQHPSSRDKRESCSSNTERLSSSRKRPSGSIERERSVGKRENNSSKRCSRSNSCHSNRSKRHSSSSKLCSRSSSRHSNSSRRRSSSTDGQVISPSKGPSTVGDKKGHDEVIREVRCSRSSSRTVRNSPCSSLNKSRRDSSASARCARKASDENADVPLSQPLIDTALTSRKSVQLLSREHWQQHPYDQQSQQQKIEQHRDQLGVRESSLPLLKSPRQQLHLQSQASDVVVETQLHEGLAKGRRCDQTREHVRCSRECNGRIDHSAGARHEQQNEQLSEDEQQALLAGTLSVNSHGRKDDRLSYLCRDSTCSKEGTAPGGTDAADGQAATVGKSQQQELENNTKPIDCLPSESSGCIYIHECLPHITSSSSSSSSCCCLTSCSCVKDASNYPCSEICNSKNLRSSSSTSCSCVPASEFDSLYTSHGVCSDIAAESFSSGRLTKEQRRLLREVVGGCCKHNTEAESAAAEIESRRRKSIKTCAVEVYRQAAEATAELKRKYNLISPGKRLQEESGRERKSGAAFPQQQERLVLQDLVSCDRSSGGVAVNRASGVTTSPHHLLQHTTRPSVHRQNSRALVKDKSALPEGEEYGLPCAAVAAAAAALERRSQLQHQQLKVLEEKLERTAATSALLKQQSACLSRRNEQLRRHLLSTHPGRAVVPLTCVAAPDPIRSHALSCCGANGFSSSSSSSSSCGLLTAAGIVEHSSLESCCEHGGTTMLDDMSAEIVTPDDNDTLLLYSATLPGATEVVGSQPFLVGVTSNVLPVRYAESRVSPISLCLPPSSVSDVLCSTELTRNVAVTTGRKENCLSSDLSTEELLPAAVAGVRSRSPSRRQVGSCHIVKASSSSSSCHAMSLPPIRHIIPGGVTAKTCEHPVSDCETLRDYVVESTTRQRQRSTSRRRQGVPDVERGDQLEAPQAGPRKTSKLLQRQHSRKSSRTGSQLQTVSCGEVSSRGPDERQPQHGRSFSKFSWCVKPPGTATQSEKDARGSRSGAKPAASLTSSLEDCWRTALAFQESRRKHMKKLGTGTSNSNAGDIERTSAARHSGVNRPSSSLSPPCGAESRATKSRHGSRESGIETGSSRIRKRSSSGRTPLQSDIDESQTRRSRTSSKRRSISTHTPPRRSSSKHTSPRHGNRMPRDRHSTAAADAGSLQRRSSRRETSRNSYNGCHAQDGTPRSSRHSAGGFRRSTSQNRKDGRAADNKRHTRDKRDLPYSTCTSTHSYRGDPFFAPAGGNASAHDFSSASKNTSQLLSSQALTPRGTAAAVSVQNKTPTHGDTAAAAVKETSGRRKSSPRDVFAPRNQKSSRRITSQQRRCRPSEQRHVHRHPEDGSPTLRDTQLPAHQLEQHWQDSSKQVELQKEQQEERQKSQEEQQQPKKRQCLQAQQRQERQHQQENHQKQEVEQVQGGYPEQHWPRKRNKRRKPVQKPRQGYQWHARPLGAVRTLLPFMSLQGETEDILDLEQTTDFHADRCGLQRLLLMKLIMERRRIARNVALLRHLTQAPALATAVSVLSGHCKTDASANAASAAHAIDSLGATNLRTETTSAATPAVTPASSFKTLLGEEVLPCSIPLPASLKAEKTSLTKSAEAPQMTPDAISALTGAFPLSNEAAIGATQEEVGGGLTAITASLHNETTRAGCSSAAAAGAAATVFPPELLSENTKEERLQVLIAESTSAEACAPPREKVVVSQAAASSEATSTSSMVAEQVERRVKATAASTTGLPYALAGELQHCHASQVHESDGLRLGGETEPAISTSTMHFATAAHSPTASDRLPKRGDAAFTGKTLKDASGELTDHGERWSFSEQQTKPAEAANDVEDGVTGLQGNVHFGALLGGEVSNLLPVLSMQTIAARASPVEEDGSSQAEGRTTATLRLSQTAATVLTESSEELTRSSTACSAMGDASPTKQLQATTAPDAPEIKAVSGSPTLEDIRETLLASNTVAPTARKSETATAMQYFLAALLSCTARRAIGSRQASASHTADLNPQADTGDADTVAAVSQRDITAFNAEAKQGATVYPASTIPPTVKITVTSAAEALTAEKAITTSSGAATDARGPSVLLSTESEEVIEVSQTKAVLVIRATTECRETAAAPGCTDSILEPWSVAVAGGSGGDEQNDGVCGTVTIHEQKTAQQEASGCLAAAGAAVACHQLELVSVERDVLTKPGRGEGEDAGAKTSAVMAIAKECAVPFLETDRDLLLSAEHFADVIMVLEEGAKLETIAAGTLDAEGLFSDALTAADTRSSAGADGVAAGAPAAAPGVPAARRCEIEGRTGVVSFAAINTLPASEHATRHFEEGCEQHREAEATKSTSSLCVTTEAPATTARVHAVKATLQGCDAADKLDPCTENQPTQASQVASLSRLSKTIIVVTATQPQTALVSQSDGPGEVLNAQMEEEATAAAAGEKNAEETGSTEEPTAKTKGRSVKVREVPRAVKTETSTMAEEAFQRVDASAEIAAVSTRAVETETDLEAASMTSEETTEAASAEKTAIETAQAAPADEESKATIAAPPSQNKESCAEEFSHNVTPHQPQSAVKECSSQQRIGVGQGGYIAGGHTYRGGRSTSGTERNTSSCSTRMRTLQCLCASRITCRGSGDGICRNGISWCSNGEKCDRNSGSVDRRKKSDSGGIAKANSPGVNNVPMSIPSKTEGFPNTCDAGNKVETSVALCASTICRSGAYPQSFPLNGRSEAAQRERLYLAAERASSSPEEKTHDCTSRILTNDATPGRSNATPTMAIASIPAVIEKTPTVAVHVAAACISSSKDDALSCADTADTSIHCSNTEDVRLLPDTGSAAAVDVFEEIGAGSGAPTAASNYPSHGVLCGDLNLITLRKTSSVQLQSAEVTSAIHTSELGTTVNPVDIVDDTGVCDCAKEYCTADTSRTVSLQERTIQQSSQPPGTSKLFLSVCAGPSPHAANALDGRQRRLQGESIGALAVKHPQVEEQQEREQPDFRQEHTMRRRASGGSDVKCSSEKDERTTKKAHALLPPVMEEEKRGTTTPGEGRETACHCSAAARHHAQITFKERFLAAFPTDGAVSIRGPGSVCSSSHSRRSITGNNSISGSVLYEGMTKNKNRRLSCSPVLLLPRRLTHYSAGHQALHETTRNQQISHRKKQAVISRKQPQRRNVCPLVQHRLHFHVCRQRRHRLSFLFKRQARFTYSRQATRHVRSVLSLLLLPRRHRAEQQHPQRQKNSCRQQLQCTGGCAWRREKRKKERLLGSRRIAPERGAGGERHTAAVTALHAHVIGGDVPQTTAHATVPRHSDDRLWQQAVYGIRSVEASARAAHVTGCSGESTADSDFALQEACVIPRTRMFSSEGPPPANEQFHIEKYQSHDFPPTSEDVQSTLRTAPSGQWTIILAKVPATRADTVQRNIVYFSEPGSSDDLHCTGAPDRGERHVGTVKNIDVETRQYEQQSKQVQIFKEYSKEREKQKWMPQPGERSHQIQHGLAHPGEDEHIREKHMQPPQWQDRRDGRPQLQDIKQQSNENSSLEQDKETWRLPGMYSCPSQEQQSAGELSCSEKQHISQAALDRRQQQQRSHQSRQSQQHRSQQLDKIGWPSQQERRQETGFVLHSKEAREQQQEELQQVLPTLRVARRRCEACPLLFLRAQQNLMCRDGQPQGHRKQQRKQTERSLFAHVNGRPPHFVASRCNSTSSPGAAHLISQPPQAARAYSSRVPTARTATYKRPPAERKLVGTAVVNEPAAAQAGTPPFAAVPITPSSRGSGKTETGWRAATEASARSACSRRGRQSSTSRIDVSSSVETVLLLARVQQHQHQQLQQQEKALQRLQQHVFGGGTIYK